MAGAIGSAEAGEEYRRRHGRPAPEDAWLGWMAGGSLEVVLRIVHRLDGLARESQSMRPRRERGALPGWAETGFRGLVRWLRASPQVGGAACDGLRALEPDVVLPELNAGSALSLGEVDAEKIVTFARVVFANPAEKPALLGFRAGVDAWMQARYGERASPSQLALLSGFVGVETYDALRPVSERWSDRIRKSRPALEDIAKPFVDVGRSAGPDAMELLAQPARETLLTVKLRREPR